VLTRYIWFRIGTSGPGSWEHGNEPSGTIKVGNFVIN
jgi:hypothetical protein